MYRVGDEAKRRWYGPIITTALIAAALIAVVSPDAAMAWTPRNTRVTAEQITTKRTTAKRTTAERSKIVRGLLRTFFAGTGHRGFQRRGAFRTFDIEQKVENIKDRSLTGGWRISNLSVQQDGRASFKAVLVTDSGAPFHALTTVMTGNVGKRRTSLKIVDYVHDRKTHQRKKWIGTNEVTREGKGIKIDKRYNGGESRQLVGTLKQPLEQLTP